MFAYRQLVCVWQALVFALGNTTQAVKEKEKVFRVEMAV